MNGLIYKITNDINNKIYIGKTLHSSIEIRFNEHKSDAKRQRCEKRPLYDAINKYGEEHFFIELIEEVPFEELSNREIYWIKYYNSYGVNGYNATSGGDGKPLYDYTAIIQGFQSGKLIKELAEEFGCCKDVIHNALTLANIETNTNARKKSCRKICAKDKDGILLKKFDSRAEAVIWLKELGLAAPTARQDNVIAAIGRAANGQRKFAYGMIWENL